MIGVDVTPPQTDLPLQFEHIDLGEEASTRSLYELLRDSHASAVVHLAFVIDPVRSGVLDVERIQHWLKMGALPTELVPHFDPCGV